MDTAYFKDKVVIVTGASSGIGLASAKVFGSYGARVVMASRSLDRMLELAPQVSSDPDKVLCVKTDVSVEADCRNLVEETVAKFGGIDILVNNAGVTKDGLLMRMSDDDWDKVIDINLKGTFLFTRAVSRPMMKNKGADGQPAGGAIVNIASVVGITGNAGQANYTASKGGVIALTKTVAKELGSRQIRCNAVAPGFIRSQMTDVLPDDVKKQYADTIPLKRFGEVADVANVVAWLASDAASYVTGQVIGVNGGMVG